MAATAMERYRKRDKSDYKGRTIGTFKHRTRSSTVTKAEGQRSGQVRTDVPELLEALQRSSCNVVLYGR